MGRPPATKQTLIKRLLRYHKPDDAGCWNWQRSVSSNGYGQTWDGKKVTYAHRLSYRLFVGTIEEASQIDHLCRNRLCINPQHLEVVTPKENVQRSPRAQTVACKYGHEYTDDNLSITKRDRRVCKTCARQHQRAHRLRKKRTRAASTRTEANASAQTQTKEPITNG